MTDSKSTGSQPATKPSLFQNWLSLIGLVLSASAFFAVLCLIAMDLIGGSPNPYMGILTYIIAPAFLILGLLLLVTGALLERRHRHHLTPGEVPRNLRIDFNIPQHRRTFLIASVISFIFLLLTAFGSYQTFHFTESVQFCGQTCHSVMKPEFTAYQNSAHARVTCVECHIGSGVGWFVKSKLSGSYQVYSVIANKYSRPIPTPIKNLRPAQETCEKCHWPQKFFGNAERVNYHYLSDETNTAWQIRLLMKIGGGDPMHGPVGGIHWHMNIGNKVEYIATDEARQKIPWVRVTERSGKVTVFESADEKLKPEQIAAASPRVVDCIDCHNRPSHIYNAPNKSVNVAMATGRIDPHLPFVKKNAVEALLGDYKTDAEAFEKIAAKLKDYDAKTVAEVQKIYSQNFFPVMNVNWRKYPNNIGHTIFPGCYRCHDGKHKASDGRAISHDCNSCHTIIEQGSGEKLAQIAPNGLEFEHPVDIGDMWKEMNCSDCHDGGAAQ